MKKNTKKLLSAITAGLFVLQSIPFMAVGATASTEALKYTPTLDGVKDDAYGESYSYTETTTYGDWTFSFLYDDSYIYVYADIADLTKSSLFSIGMSMTDPVAGSWDVFSSDTGSLAYLVSNPFLEGYAIRHWENPAGGSGWKNMGANLGWQNTPANADEGTYVKEGTSSPASEYALVVGDAGAVLEFRVDYNDITNTNKVTFAVADNVNEPTSGYHKLWGANGATANNQSFTLGAEYVAGGDEPVVDPATTALKYTPTLDGVKDDAYGESYSYTETTTYGDWTFSFLYDDSYIYVYADIADLTKSSLFSIGMSMTDPVAGSWDVFSSDTGSLAYLVSNPFLEGYAIRHWENPVGGSGWKNMGANLGWQNTPLNAEEGTYVKEGTSSPASEYALVVGDAGAVLEFRVDYNDVGNTNKVSFAVADNVNEPTSGYHKLWGANGATANYQSFTLGAEYVAGGDEPVVDPAVAVKKGTPTIDGVMDGIWYDTVMVDTLVLAKNGEGKLGWCATGNPDVQKLVDAGLITGVEDVKTTDVSSLPIDAAGNFDDDAFTHAEIYFLWNDGNLYTFTKVYDNDIVLPTDADQNTGLLDIADITWTAPWINEAVLHTVNYGTSVFTTQALPAGLCFDSTNDPAQSTCVGWHEGISLGECDTITKGNTLLHCNAHSNVDVHKADRDQYLGVEVNPAEGYYTIELCIPLSETLASSLLNNGEEFSYTYEFTDIYKKGLGSSFKNTHEAETWMKYTGLAQNLTIADTEAVAPDCIHEWNAEPTVIKEATCTATGSQNIRCGLCGEVKPNSQEEIPALGHDYVDGKCTVCGEREIKTVYKYTPTLDGELDAQYLSSAVLKFEELVADGKYYINGWQVDNTTMKNLADAGLIELEKDADGNYVKNGEDLYVVVDGNITADEAIDNEYLTKADSYFLWDDGNLYIYSKVYDNDPLNVDDAFIDPDTKEVTGNIYENIGTDRPWLNDIVTHKINPENNIFATMEISGMAYGNAIWDTSGWSTLNDFQYSDATTRRFDADNIKYTVNEDEGWYAVEMRIPISDKDFGGTPLNESFLQDGKQFTYNLQLMDGYKKAIGSSFSGYQAAQWHFGLTNAGTVFALSAAEPPHVHEYGEVVEVTAATCTTAGAGTQTCACGDVIDVEIPALGHDIVIDAAVEATCTEAGLTEGSHCSRCEDATVAQEAVDALGHIDEDSDNACDRCGESLGLPGDIDGSGEIDVKDLTRLMKIIAGDSEAVAMVNPDVNGDGEVSVSDLTRLMKAIAGEEVELH